MAAPHGSVRSPIALVFLSLSTLMITLSSLVMCSAVLYVLFQLKQATSPGNGAKYRFWLQLIIKNVLTVILCHISSIVTLTADDWVLGDVMCHGLGVMHIYFLACTFSMLCVMHFYQYLAIVMNPQEHPEPKHAHILWALGWCVPVLVVIPPAAGITELHDSYNRALCTFTSQEGQDHDSSLVVLMASVLGFTAVFCTSLTLKCHVTLNESNTIGKVSKTVSLFGDTMVKTQRKQPTIDHHKEDFRTLCYLTLANFLLFLPYFILIFTCSANKKSPGRGVEEFVMFIIRLTPIVDITVLLNDIVFRQKMLELVHKTDYKCRCFQLRQRLKTRIIPVGTLQGDQVSIISNDPVV